MTHEELLAKIKTGNEFLGVKYAPDSHTFALRAVVELHKPFQFEDDFDVYKPVCIHCQNGVVGDSYPCETIQAIEKELG